MRRKRKSNRWGTLKQIRHVRKVPGPAYNRLPRKLKHLASWRAMHVKKSHKSVRSYARRNGVKPSSNLSLKQKLAYVQRHLR